MKKTLALLLSLVLVATACGAMFVSAEAANLALGKEVLNAEVNVANGNYCANMTDGVIADAISTENGVWFGYLYNADKPENANTAADGVAIPTIDLGEVTELSSVRIHIVDQADWGIAAPHSIVAQVSNDGENFTDVTTVTEFQSGVAWVEFDLSGQSAQYVRLAIDLATTWFFLDEIEIYGASAGSDEPVEPDAPVAGKNWENTMVEGEDGNYSCEVPYGYTWNVNYVDGTIAGEDVTVCTTQAAYDVCNPNWA
ncbi:MAG: discoidin domain-containing protein, partial [Clostridia bacterium]|nr:discoidin domain-containing protein [Clostridia bacterium]